MTVNTLNSVAEFVTNGVTTDFPFFFKFLENADLAVTYVNPQGVSSLLVLGTNYTVNGAGNDSGGSITTTTALAGPGQLIVSREMDAYQLTALRNQGKFLAETHEDVFDKLTMLVQQGFSIFKRALTRPFGRDYFYAEDRRIANVKDPVEAQDAATKGWASTYFGGLIDGATGLINTTTGILYDAGTLFDYLRYGVGRQVDSIAALRLLAGSRNQRATVLGYYVRGDGGGGEYFIDPLDTTTADNGGTVIRAADGARWKLVVRGRVSVLQFGAKPNDSGAGAINTQAFQTAMNAYGSVYVPSGYYFISGILFWRSGLYLFGDNPGGATGDSQTLPGAARLIFTGAGPTCIGQPSATSAIMHGGISNISWQTDSRDFLVDWYGTLSFTLSGIRMENTKVNGAGFRSQQIGTNPTWLNHAYDIEIRIPDASTGYNWDVDWSDSEITMFALTGGKGAVDRGPGNMNYIGGICDRANSAGHGLLLTGSAQSNKQTMVTGVKFDDNDGYGLILDAHLNITGVFTPTITGCVFRNPSTATAYDILIINSANPAAPVMRGGTIVGNSFSQENRIPYNVDDSTWSGIVIGPNRTPFTAATPFPVDTPSGSLVIGSTGINVPNGPTVLRGTATVKGRPGVGCFVTRVGGGAGVYLGVDGAGAPFVGASSDASGVNKDLNFFTANAVRTTLAADGTAFYPQADNAMSLGFSGKRYSVVWAGTGTINTSDAREKTEVSAMSAQEISAAKKLGREIGTYRFLQSIDGKGEGARLHIGMTVQRAVEILAGEGLDPMAYAFICYDEWPAEEGLIESVRYGVLRDGDGIVVSEKYPETEIATLPEAYKWEYNLTEEIVVRPSEPAGNRFGFRMDQLLAFIARGFEARLSEIESRP